MRNSGNLKVTTRGDREILMTREFDAPRALVFEAFTKPELLKRWLFGPPGWSLDVCEIDLRVGGKSHFVWNGPGAESMRMRGVCREVVPPERIVATETFELGCENQMGEQLNTTVFTEEGGKTKLSITLLFPSKEARDGMIASGMEHGAAAGYDRLSEILRGMTAAAR